MTGARASSDAAFARATCIRAGTGSAPFGRGICRGVSKGMREKDTIQSFSISVTLRAHSVSCFKNEDVWVCKQHAYSPVVLFYKPSSYTKYIKKCHILSTQCRPIWLEPSGHLPEGFLFLPSLPERTVVGSFSFPGISLFFYRTFIHQWAYLNLHFSGFTMYILFEVLVFFSPSLYLESFQTKL